MAENTNLDIWFAGAFAAFTVDLLVYPLDTLKTRIQSPDYTKLYKDSNGATRRSLYRGLYQGIGSVILITIPSSGAFFTTYEALKYTINEACPPNSTLYLPQPAINAISSAGAELVSCAILTPAEVLKQNAQVIVQDGSKRGSSTTLKVLKEFKSNPTRLFRGYTALAARNLPFTGLQFPIFEHLKGYFLQQRNAKKEGDASVTMTERAMITAMSAAIAGSGAAWITTPVDVVKTRMMLAASKSNGKSEKADMSKLLTHGIGRSTGKSPFAVAGEVFNKEGVRGLFRGALLRAVWTSLGSGLYLGCYEGGRYYLEENRKKHDGDHVMQKDYKDVKVGIGKSRSQDTVKKSAWQDD